MTKSRFFFVACLLLLVGGAAWYYLFGTSDFDQAKKNLKESAQNAVLSNAKPEDVAALAVKAIEMKQGEHGVELWRLKAEWGNVRQEGGLLELKKPKFTYLMPPDNAELQVTSEQGEVNQTTKIIRFIQSVVVTQGNNTLRAPIMVYNGTAKTLLFPQGAEFDGRGVEGTAANALWRLNDRVIDASDGVDMTWERAVDLTAVPRQHRNGTKPHSNSTAPASSPVAP